jgi:uncharacterized protein YidB (DUF937 family)
MPLAPPADEGATVPDKKLLTAAALTATLAVGGGVGALLGQPLVSGAQQSDDPTTTTTEAPVDEGARRHRGGPGLEAAAEALGIGVDDLRAALEDDRTIAEVAEERGVDLQTVIDAMVADATERIDERAASAKEDLPERITDLVNGELPEGHGPRGGFRAGLEAAAEALGISVEDLRTAVREDDRTIAQVAEERGVDLQTVIDAMVAEATARIDERVAEGDLDADRAAELKEGLPERITDVVNGEGPGPGGFRHGPGPGGFGFGD